MRFLQAISVALFISFTGYAHASDDWVEKSNAYTEKLLLAQAEFSPESASSTGLEQFDEQIMDLAPKRYERMQKMRRDMLAYYQKALKSEDDPRIRQDLEILIGSLEDGIESARLSHEKMFGFFNVPSMVFGTVNTMTQKHVSPERQQTIVTRLNKYAGLVDGHRPFTELAIEATERRLKDKKLIGPFITQLENDIENGPRFIEGIKTTMEASGLTGWEPAYEALSKQFEDYLAWAEEKVKPRARQDFRLPAEIYADNLKNYGVTISPQQLIDRSTVTFMDLRVEMNAIAKDIAEERGFASSDYRDVIRELKKEQYTSENIMPSYFAVLADIEAMIREHDLVSLPDREAQIRLASPAESAALPVPHMRPPRLVNNQGEQGTFVLPLNNPNSDSGEQMDDFLNASFAWALTAHEARPGHEMQFAAMVENGVSTARSLFAFKSANVEGWALYAETIVHPYFPKEGQLFALLSRAMRAARAFLDPMLNLGMITREQAKEFLMTEVVLSEPMALQEIDRYTFRAPGQANSYFFGYSSIQRIRTITEIELREDFDEKAFHDFILAQGLLPPDLLEKAVLEDFVPSQR